MGWKDWSAWLKGGIILCVLDLISFLSKLPALLNSGYDDSLAFGWVLTHLPLSLILVLHSPLYAYEIFLMFLVGILNWFIIGSIIGLIVGWVVGKIKRN